MKIGPVSQGVESTKADREAAKVCNEFEGVFLRQLLTVAKVGDQGGSSGYGPMIIDSLATAIGDAGGLGLASKIQEALLSSETSGGASK
jgi:Rod binding domain-containing protein